MRFSISIIIPAYNEFLNIERAILKTHDYLNKNNYDFEIIIINDGSTDKTKELCLKHLDKIIYIENSINKGKGFSVKRGIEICCKKNILFMDADLSTDINHINDFVLYSKNFDIVIGSRNLPKSKLYRDRPFYRKIMGKLFATLVYTFSNLNLKDTQCGFKFFKSEIAKKIAKKSKINGWSFDVEFLTIANVNNFTIKEIPVKWVNHYETSKVSPFKTSIEMIGDYIKILTYDYSE